MPTIVMSMANPYQTRRIEPIDAQELMRLKDRFVTRANAVFGARFGFLAIDLLVCCVPPWRLYFFAALGNWVSAFIFFRICYTFFADAKKTDIRYGRWIYFITLHLDLIWACYIIVETGGLKSPLLALCPVITMLFALLFHSASSLLPPLSALPLITILSMHRPPVPTSGMQILYLASLAILCGVVIYLMTYSLSHEEDQSRKIWLLEKKLRRLAVLEERARLSREIHDGIGAYLSGLILQSEYILQLAPDDTPIKREIEELKLAGHEAIDELRCALSMMRNDFDLKRQLQSLAANFKNRTSIVLDVDLEHLPASMTHEQELMVFRILQESLTNIIKHAQAKHVKLQTSLKEDAFYVEICDDGVGFETDTRVQGHYGLINMRERAKKNGGEITITSAPQRGTSIVLKINIAVQTQSSSIRTDKSMSILESVVTTHSNLIEGESL